jgi:copper chaperone CopZ
MKSFILISSLILSSLAFADTATYEVKGMHCGGCKAEVEGLVCKMEGVKSCKAELTDKKKQMGKITIITEDGKPVDSTKVEEMIASSGDFKVVKSAKK